MLLRREQAADRDAIRAVHDRAFPTGPTGASAEGLLVDRLRESGDVVPGLSVVAEVDHEVVGHVVCSRGQIDTLPVVGLGPIGVVETSQRRAIGSALMHAVVGAADALAEPAVLLLGEPRFYRRFGFVPATDHEVTAPDPSWGEYFQIRTLSAWDSRYHGEFSYAAPFAQL